MNEQLINAAEKNDLNKVIKLHQNGADISFKDNGALRYASYYGNFRMVKYLVENGANVNTKHNGVLFWANYLGHKDVVNYLVSHGAKYD